MEELLSKEFKDEQTDEDAMEKNNQLELEELDFMKFKITLTKSSYSADHS